VNKREKSSKIGRVAKRVGDTVRRPPNPWTSTIQALLGHLNGNAIEVPHFLGHDESGAEILSWVDGVSGQDASGRLKSEIQTDEVLVETAELIRKVHDATTGFQKEGLEWNPLLRDPSDDDEIVCHNDLSFWNVIFRRGRPAALIDWEFAAPGSRLWDLAYASWWLVPLHRPEAATALGWRKLDQPRRLRLFIDAYGLGDATPELLDVVHLRQLANQRQLQQWMTEGIIPTFDATDPAIECGRTDYVDGQRNVLEEALLP
jgi:hypothetical protein